MKPTIALLLFMSPLLAIAQTGTTSPATTTEQAVVSTSTASTTMQGSSGIAVASVNLASAQLVKLGTTTYAVSFSLFNTGETQKGVRYVVLLAEEDGGIILMKSFDKELTLEKNKTVAVSEEFAVPKGLSGTYIVQVRALTASGLPLGVATAGEITVKDKALLELLSCTADQKGYAINQILKVTCDVKEIKKGTLAGTETGGYVVSGNVFYGNEPTAVQHAIAEIQNGKATLSVQELSDPGTYTIRAILQERDGAPVGKEESTLFTVQGTKVSVLNSLLNKDIYQKGESALATLALKVITFGTTSPLTLTNTLSGEQGACAALIAQEVGGRSAIQFEIPITADCINPTLVTEIKNVAGDMLASSTVAYKSPIRGDALKQPSPSVTAQDKMIYGGTGAFGILVGLLSVFIARKKTQQTITTV